MAARSHILGIDIGSVSVSVAELGPRGAVKASAYRFHHGNITETLEQILAGFNLGRIGAVAATTSTPAVVNSQRRYDNQLSVIKAARHFHEKVGSILLVGGENSGSSSLIATAIT
ncbi:MAG: hypothetical protein ABIJ56_18320 [Pseudomonadota bacterium]